jgi:hypothetical protein
MSFLEVVEGFRPDFGAFMLKHGDPGTNLIFRDVSADHVTFLDVDTMSITGKTTLEGQAFAVTFDIPMALFDEFFADAPDSVMYLLAAGLHRVSDFPATIILMDRHLISFRARLGVLTRGAYETFVPFVVEEVLPRL